MAKATYTCARTEALLNEAQPKRNDASVYEHPYLTFCPNQLYMFVMLDYIINKC